MIKVEDIEMTPEEFAKAKKMAAAIWMTKHNATEKSFYRTLAWHQKLCISDAHYLIQTAEKIGIKMEITS